MDSKDKIVRESIKTSPPHLYTISPHQHPSITLSKLESSDSFYRHYESSPRFYSSSFSFNRINLFRFAMISTFSFVLSSFFFFSSTQGTSASSIEVGERGYETSRWILEQHLGNLSPYFTAPLSHGIKNRIPEGCKVDQVSLMHRHGSRYPIPEEIVTIANLSYYINNNTEMFSNPRSKLPKAFEFLSTKGWENEALITNNLSSIGRKQLFDHGVDFSLKFPDLYTNEILAGGQERVVESAQWFAAGYYGSNANSTATLNVIGENNATISFITPMDTCAKWSYSSGGIPVNEWGKVYLPRISSRINRNLKKSYPEIAFTDIHAHAMLYNCAYETAVKGGSDWCGVFKRSEIEDFEYELDLLMRGAFGYGLPDSQGPVIGSLYISNLTERLNQDGTNLYLEFGHDTTIDLILTALGLVNDRRYPTSGPVNPSRNWRTSYQVPFAAQMVSQRLSCGSSPSRFQILLNDSPLDLSPVCKIDRFGSCSLDEFLGSEMVQKANQVKQGDERWVAACGEGV